MTTPSKQSRLQELLIFVNVLLLRAKPSHASGINPVLKAGL